VPAIPTVLSLPMVEQLIKWGERSASRSSFAAFLNMVDRRRHWHRRARERTVGEPVFLAAEIPYASIVEQMAVRRMPLGAYAAREAAAIAFIALWEELQVRLERRAPEDPSEDDRWSAMRRVIDTLINRFGPEWESPSGIAEPESPDVVHVFDADRPDLCKRRQVLELRECGAPS
jgi:hypothetical protein